MIRLENKRPVVHTQDTTIVEQFNVALVVQTQERDVNELLDIGRKGVILIIGLVVHDAETQHHYEELGKIEPEDSKKKGTTLV
jgi:hypothetical protein